MGLGQGNEYKVLTSSVVVLATSSSLWLFSWRTHAPLGNFLRDIGAPIVGSNLKYIIKISMFAPLHISLINNTVAIDCMQVTILNTHLQAFSRSSGDMSSKPLALFTLHQTSANDIIPPQSYKHKQ